MNVHPRHPKKPSSPGVKSAGDASPSPSTPALKAYDHFSTSATGARAGGDGGLVSPYDPSDPGARLFRKFGPPAITTPYAKLDRVDTPSPMLPAYLRQESDADEAPTPTLDTRRTPLVGEAETETTAKVFRHDPNPNPRRASDMDEPPVFQNGPPASEPEGPEGGASDSVHDETSAEAEPGAEKKKARDGRWMANLSSRISGSHRSFLSSGGPGYPGRAGRGQAFGAGHKGGYSAMDFMTMEAMDQHQNAVRNLRGENKRNDR